MEIKWNLELIQTFDRLKVDAMSERCDREAVASEIAVRLPARGNRRLLKGVASSR